MNNKKIKNLFLFYIQAEKLKTTMRHSWTSDSSRQESTAEHSWMLCLIALTIFDQMNIKVDQLRVLKILIIHDLAETIIGDIPAFDTVGRKNKKEREHEAMKQIVKDLPTEIQKEFLSLLEEYDERQTSEAKVAQAIDKFEAPLQHNISDISTWDQNDFTIHGRYKENYLEFDSFLKVLREELEYMSQSKITKAKKLHLLPEEIQTYYKKLNDNENK